jgi:ribosome-interacting GTPase 1
MEAVITQLERMRIVIGDAEAREESEFTLWPKKVLIIGNKLDREGARQNYTALRKEYGGRLPVIAVSAKEGAGLEELKHKIYEVLDIIRVYTKVPGKKPDFTEPIILKRGSTLADAAAEVHKDFAAKMKYARLWGSGKHDGVMAKRDHILEDGDIIELHL